MTAVVRIGDTVRRTAGPWTPAVHAHLRHLRANGFAEAPEPLGFDDQGREMLRFIPGDVERATPRITETTLVAVGRMIRRMHDASRGFALPQGAAWRAASSGPVICHNDLAPRNVVFRDGLPVGLVDWDLAGPNEPSSDLAHAAWEFVPLRDNAQCAALGWAGPPDRGSRLRVLVDAYGLDAGDRAGLPDQLVARIRATKDGIETGAAAGDQGLAALARLGVPAQIERELAWVTANLATLREALQ